MSNWTYKDELDELEIDLQEDKNTPGRWTFHRLMYFEPDQYERWSKGQKTNGQAYLSEIIGDSHIPKKGKKLTYPLDDFYVKEIVSIDTMTSEDHIDRFSYAVVDILYENKKELQDTDPWKMPVNDFSVTNVASEVPAMYINDNPLLSATQPYVYPKTTADQPLYDLTMNKFTKRITWTCATSGVNFDLSGAFVNANDIVFWSSGNYNGGSIRIPSGQALILPPGMKRSFHRNISGELMPYDEWSYEIIVNDQGHELEYRNAGKQAKDLSGNVFDICGWYTVTPPSGAGSGTISGYTFTRKFGSYDQMIEDQRKVETNNLRISLKYNKEVFYGDFVDADIPLDLSGHIDYSALSGLTLPEKLSKEVYPKLNVVLGTAPSANIAFREEEEV